MNWKPLFVHLKSIFLIYDHKKRIRESKDKKVRLNAKSLKESNLKWYVEEYRIHYILIAN